jgi:methionyl-tRNA formyltransferase
VVGDVPFRIAFFGTPAFAVPTLESLLASNHRVAVVVTQPDRPRGRGQKVVAGPVKALAVARGLTVLQPEKLVQDALAPELQALDLDLGVVAAYGKILPEWLIARPRLGMINVHASLLPRYRGASPIHRAVMNGDSETGVTIMRVVKALDAGAMLSSLRVPIDPDETSEELEKRLAVAGARLLVETVDEMERGRVIETPQDDALSTYAPRLRKEEGLIDWSGPAADIHNQVRGLHPWPHAFTFGPSGRLIVHRSAHQPAEGGQEAGAADTSERSAPPGTIVAADPAHGLIVSTGRGTLHLLEVQAEGGRVQPADQFLLGHTLEPGARFGPP